MRSPKRLKARLGAAVGLLIVALGVLTRILAARASGALWLDAMREVALSPWWIALESVVVIAAAVALWRPDWYLRVHGLRDPDDMETEIGALRAESESLRGQLSAQQTMSDAARRDAAEDMLKRIRWEYRVRKDEQTLSQHAERVYGALSDFLDAAYLGVEGEQFRLRVPFWISPTGDANRIWGAMTKYIDEHLLPRAASLPMDRDFDPEDERWKPWRKRKAHEESPDE